MNLAAQLAAHIATLPGVREGASRFGPSGRAAWFVSGREFAHLHADDLLDLRLPRRIQASVKEDPRAHFRKSRSEWLEFEFHQPQDIGFLVPLVYQAWAAARDHDAD
jgi:hypothetical protein